MGGQDGKHSKLRILKIAVMMIMIEMMLLLLMMSIE